MAYVAGIVLSVPALLVWRMPRRWWLALDGWPWWRLKAMLQSIPAATLGAWLLFGVFFQIDTSINRRGASISVVEGVAMIACGVPWATTLIGGWPLWLVPPGARNLDDARYFTSHWAGIFGLGMLAAAVFAVVMHAWWEAAGVCLVAGAALVLIQLTWLRRRSPTGR